MYSGLLNKLAFIAIAVLLASSTQASLIIDGGTAGSTGFGSTNDVIPGKPGFYGANLKVDVDSIVTFSFVGYEAGWNNYLRNTQNSSFIYNKGAPQGSFEVTASAGSFVNFFFDTPIGDVFNGSNAAKSSGSPNFWLGSNGLGGIWIALDDTGANVDDNHDDLVILATAREVTQVPEPTSLFLMGIGALGLIVQRRRIRA